VEYRRSEPKGEIVLTGHSLGGALAVLTYSRFSDENTSLYTIGCPRVGNGVFRERMQASPGKGHVRCVNFNDLVPHVPPEDLFYRHAPEACYRFDDKGSLDCSNPGATLASDLADMGRMVCSLPADIRTNVKQLNLPAPAGLVDHSPARYCMRLWDCV
jgi:pimeloyl-ACP methyl ester carboxylesterase